MKKSRFLAIFMTLAFLGTLLLPTVGFAAGLTSNYVEREVNVADDVDTADFGALVIKEGEDFPNTFSEDEVDPSVITFTLVDGVEFDPSTVEDADDEDNYEDIIANLFDGSSDTLNITLKSMSDNSLTVEVYSTEADTEKEKLRLSFPEMAIDSDFSGAVKVRVDSLDGNVTSGEYVIGNVLGSECVATAVNKPDLAVGDTEVKLGTIRITENAIGALCDDGEIVITLPDDYDWVDYKLGGSLKEAVVDEAYDNEELTLTVENAGLGYRGILDITPIVDIPYDAEPGDCVVTVEGDADLDMDSVDLVLADVKDFGNTVSIEKVEEFYAGAWDEELAKITVESNAEGSIIQGRYIVAELSNNAKFVYDTVADEEDETAEDLVPDLGNFTCTDVSDNKIVWKTNDDVNETEFDVDKLEIALNLSMPGDVTMKFSGTAGVEGELVVAKSLAPVTATVENATEVKIGVQSQAVGDILVKESGSEAIAEGDGFTSTLTLKAPEGVKFASRPTAEVVEGNLKLDNSSLVKLRDVDGDDGQYEEAYVEIDNESKTASTVKFSNIKLSVDRGFPEGPLTLKVSGTSVVEAECAALFNSSTAASAVVASVVTPAPTDEKGSGMFLVGNSFYNLNGQMKMMDVAPYIKNGRTYVPVRYLAYVCGLSDSDIAWDAATQTVTLTKGTTVVKLVVGSTSLTVNDAPTAMDVAPEIVNGRTMLPARFVAEAFGGTVTWNATTNAVGIQF